jgi:hypothetical protein
MRPLRSTTALVAAAMLAATLTGDVDIWFVTNYGPFVVRMNRDNAPCGVHNFVHLASLPTSAVLLD